jgi:hypothetical protein
MSGNEERNVEDYLVEDNKPKDLVIDVPKSNEKGFLRRQNQLIKFMHAFESADRTGTFQPDMIENMVEFLLSFVSVPEDREEARELLWELSEDEYMYVMAAIRGVGDDVVPPTNASP